MQILNFGHPLTDGQVAAVQELAGQTVEGVISIATQFDHAQPFAGQAQQLLQSEKLREFPWQTGKFIVNPPSLAIIAATLLAELQGLCGYLPTVIRLRPVAGAVPLEFEVAELISLQQLRDAARTRRSS
ncbi:CRISPR-associated protein Csx15 [Tuwongella immobilis]|uniref:Uncharacterized protein n=1 Tax=Tuwongella immobilis TaxID=692036 RepID=A0A6C2YM90_9BACT|nr:CRISPR-associated protein Csx15 [Tuwongella immobilis]VIP02243.1 Uncharacterized protein OS=Caldanaerobacter subterraneus subsp. yonseiensis KB-1 GN=O163_06745 PE=4 SV=1 [Tuwongella immobilis]VTS00816.1 Uncharacterized protein OS=Caldanaerobacter subterraneus subsp. yonseiensis KB-1 GN=O163_06745 PE=4 SV=1 [Tuwongella immobilis]